VIINFCVVGRLGLLVRCVPPPRYLVADVRDELEDPNSRRLVDRMIERRELLVVVATEPAPVVAVPPIEVPPAPRVAPAPADRSVVGSRRRSTSRPRGVGQWRSTSGRGAGRRLGESGAGG
jgi:hypothetical protein